MLAGKTVLLGVTGSIAAYKMANVASMLVKMHAQVYVLMTRNATQFISPVTFETLTGHKCLIDTFDRNFEFSVEHVSLAKLADIVLVAPASANVIGKIANGIADDMLTTTVMACKCPKLIAPAMNTQMYENPVVQDNLEKCRHYGIQIINPDSGRLACGDIGSGKLPSEETLVDAILRRIRYEKDMEGLHVLVTAGATQEAIDPVRFISNHSTGKMGFAIARCAMERGADVTVVAASVTAKFPPFVRIVRVKSAQEMFDACMELAPQADIIIKAAAVADYTPETAAEEKIKKTGDSLSLSLKRTKDIIAHLGTEKKPGQFLCGFSMETEHMVENSRKKLEKKNLDMIVANNLKVQGAGFGTDTNIVTILTSDGTKELPIMSKDAVSYEILSEILRIRAVKPETEV